MVEVNIGARGVTCSKCGSKLSVHKTGTEPKPAIAWSALSMEILVTLGMSARRPLLESARALDRALVKLSVSSYTDTQARHCSAVSSRGERDVPAITPD